MRRARRDASFDRGGQRNDAAVALGLLLLLLGIVSACNRAAYQRPSFEHAQQAFFHGELEGSQVEAEHGYQYFVNSDPQLAWKFRVLEAEALTWRRMSQQVLALLNSPPAFLSHTLVIQVLTLEGLAHARLHHFGDADRKLQEAEQLCAATSDAACGAVARARGALAMEQGRLPLAASYFSKSLGFARARGDQFLESTALLNLGTVSLQQAHYDEAIDWLESARRLAAELDAQDLAQAVLGNLGWAYYKLGDPERALDSFSQAEGHASQLGDVHSQIVWLTTTGYVYLDRHEYSTAEQSYQKALHIAQQISSKEDILNALMSLALVSEQSGKLEAAKRYADRAMDMARTDHDRLDELYLLLVEGQVAASLHDPAQAEHMFREVADDPKSDVSLKWEAEHELARLYEEENHAGFADREYRAALSTFETARSSLKHEESQLPFLTNASRIYDDYVHFLVVRGRKEQALQVADFTRARTLTEGLGLLRKSASQKPDVLNPQAAARLAGATILFYWLGEKQSYLWAITPQKTILYPLPPAAEIDNTVVRYQKALAGPQDVLETANPDGIALYQTLVAPAQTALAKNAKVLIVPDGISLNRLNFETLLVEKPQPHYWIEDATLSSASSLRLLHGPQTSTHQGLGKLLLVGDPLAAGRDYGELPNAALEMENIEKHFAPDAQTVYARGQATAAAYLTSRPERFSYIHFVAHGIATRTSPLDSAVVLSPSATQRDSFKLYARDIVGCPLHAHLVTISTCYSAGTRAYTGEGLVGLSWAFLRAGAHNVIGSLWEVNDTSTPQLMDRFYAELNNGRSPDVALRSAKLSLLHSKGAFRRPFYWAPFLLYTGS